MARALRHHGGARRGPPARARGFSLPELLVVVAMLGLAVLVAVPLVSHQVRLARIRGAAGRFAVDLRAARMIAVTVRHEVKVTVDIDPDNTYAFTDTRGRLRRVAMPEGIRIVSSTPTIAFQSNGSVPGGSTTVFEARASQGGLDRWTVWTNAVGAPSTDHEHVP